jgi:hypothetical protein
MQIPIASRKQIVYIKENQNYCGTSMAGKYG